MHVSQAASRQKKHNQNYKFYFKWYQDTAFTIPSSLGDATELIIG
jgi:hypothetical protein